MIDHQSFIGNIGETAVCKFYNAEKSVDPYDVKKDLILEDSTTVQVKTIRENHKSSSFWIGNNKTGILWPNLDEVDKLVFVRIPESEDELAVAYLCKDHKTCWKMMNRRDGIRVRAYPLTNCEKLFTLTPEDSRAIYESSIAISVHKRKAA